MRRLVLSVLSVLSSSLLLSSLSVGAACGGDDDTMSMVPTAPPAIPDAMHGPSTPDDIDGDGVSNADDNCPSVANADQRNACTYPPRPSATGDMIRDGVARLNWYRTLVGLPEVVEDPALSRGCELHVDYLIALAAETGRPQLGHTEDLSKPYASEEGNRAGIDSVLSLGRRDIGEAIDGWMNTLYHRLPLVHPGLERVGIHYENELACVQYRPGTVGDASAPHPILWPPPDIVGTDRTFGGNEAPCPTVADPLAGGPCPGSAAIPSVGLHGMGPLSDMTGSVTNLDTGVSVPLLATYFHGGPSPHEQMGYLDHHTAHVPLPDSSLERGLYEVVVDGRVNGAPETFRWRFRTARDLPDVGCDDLGIHRTIADAYPVERGTIEGRVCEFADMYQITGEGRRTVRIVLDHAEGDLDLINLDPAGAEIARSEGTNDLEELTVDAGTYVQVYGYMGAMGPYVLTVE